MTRRSSLALCMIVRNEEKVLEGCLASVRGVVDEVVVVDTGSTDETRTIAAGFGARLVDMPWRDDFSAARNEALRHVNSDWILVLDADERLARGAGDVLRRAVREGGLDAGLLPLHDADALGASEAEVLAGRARLGEPLHLPRLFRHVDGLCWEGRVHEEPSAWLQRHAKRIQVVEADIIHLGRCREIVEAKGKSRRNIDLLERRVREEPDSYAACGYLVHEWMAVDAADRAFEVAREGLARLRRAPPNPAKAALRLVVGAVSLQLQRGEVDSALLSLEDGERHDGAHPDYHALRGLALELRARSLVGAPCLETVARARDQFGRAHALDSMRYAQRYVVGASRWVSALGEGRCALAMGDPSSAASAFARAQAEPEAAREAALGVCEALVELGRPEAALERLVPLLDGAPDGWLLAALAVERLGVLAELRGLLAEANRRTSVGYVDVRRARLHLELLGALNLYDGAPPQADAPDAVRLLSGGAQPPGSVARPELRGRVERLAANLVRLGRHGELARLSTAEAEAWIPGSNDVWRGVASGSRQR